MAEHAERFSDTVIAEMRALAMNMVIHHFGSGYKNTFFSIEFPQADHLVGLGDKVFICELMPKYPIYANLLSPEAQAVIGHVHEKTKPALRLLQKEGFEHRGYVDLFDAGPTVEAKLENISTVRESFKGEVEIVTSVPNNLPSLAISNGRLDVFKATFTDQAYLCEAEEKIQLTTEVANALEVTQGELISAFKL